MRTKSVGVLRLTVPLVLVLLLVISIAPVYAGDTVPGIDVLVEQIPGGETRTIKTDAKGTYVFDRLAPGTYVCALGCIIQP